MTGHIWSTGFQNLRNNAPLDCTFPISCCVFLIRPRNRKKRSFGKTGEIKKYNIFKNISSNDRLQYPSCVCALKCWCLASQTQYLWSLLSISIQINADEGNDFKTCRSVSAKRKKNPKCNHGVKNYAAQWSGLEGLKGFKKSTPKKIRPSGGPKRAGSGSPTLKRSLQLTAPAFNTPKLIWGTWTDPGGSIRGSTGGICKWAAK